MPRRSLHDPAADLRPASGLRDDLFDEELRRRGPVDESEDLDDSPKRRRGERRDVDFLDATRTDFVQLLEDGRRLQHPAHDWRAANRITSSEVATVFSARLLQTGETTSNVRVFLAGYELTRDERRFDVEQFLYDKLGFLPKARRKDDWRGNYSLPGIRHKLVLDLDPRRPRIEVNLRRRWHMTVFFAGGALKSDGQAEAGMLRELAERARKLWELRVRGPKVRSTVMTCCAVCVPRSEHFRKAILVEQKKPFTSYLEYRPPYFMVERMSATVIGLQEFFTFDD